MSIGVEMLNNPSILFMDGMFVLLFVAALTDVTDPISFFGVLSTEPTSGACLLYLFLSLSRSHPFPPLAGVVWVTGLDSFVAAQLIALLKEIAIKEKRTLLLSIHQPSTQIFYEFDKVS